MSAAPSTDQPIVHMKNISRRFGSIVALEDVDFKVYAGEVTGLLGDNGAGKSTLIKILTGVYPPTTGQIYFKGRPVNITSPRVARALGIETVYQDLALVPLMSVSRNFFLGREPVRWFGPFRLLDLKAMERQTIEALKDIGIEKFSKGRSVNEPVGKLSGGERQSVAIGRAVHFGASVLILDEPTSALSVAETEKVLHYTQRAKERGLAVIFISHNMSHVMRVADRYVVMRHGRKVADYRKGELTEKDLADLITGEREK
ncbi:MAG: ATP-binding cassette domain-containing protein [Anaerolineales bacterium]|nr:ATP-binding cassette domain-containing protein [Anaerolineales bacterium]